jgi:hypothetical protein
MNRLIILVISFFCINNLQANPLNLKREYFFKEEPTQGDKFIDQLLEVIKSNDKTKAQQFVVNNYCDPCLHFTPVQTYTDVIVKLQSGFNQYTILQRKSKGLKAVVLIKSVKTNEMKLIRLEVDKNDTSKIFELSANDFTGKPTDTIQIS